ncbi:hypothetical protein FRC05_007424 [Tulasnella sp. 425]|nr:hypothetical protein FRC05_007424 [Tulasnella sp. 425]
MENDRGVMRRTLHNHLHKNGKKFKWTAEVQNPDGTWVCTLGIAHGEGDVQFFTATARQKADAREAAAAEALEHLGVSLPISTM